MSRAFDKWQDRDDEDEEAGTRSPPPIRAAKVPDPFFSELNRLLDEAQTDEEFEAVLVRMGMGDELPATPIKSTVSERARGDFDAYRADPSSLRFALMSEAVRQLGRPIETLEEFVACQNWVTAAEKLEAYVMMAKPKPGDGGHMRLMLALAKTEEKLGNLAKGRTTAVRKAEFDKKRANDPARRAKKAEYERLRRERLRAARQEG